MAGVTRLRKIQIGAESTPGTAVAATTVWRGPGAFIGDLQGVELIDEDVGYIGGIDRTVTTRKLAWLGIPEAPATFEQLPYLLMAGVASVSPTGGGNDKTWTFAFATTSSPSVKTYTLEAGDNQQAHEMEYSFCEEFRLWGVQGGVLYMASTWRGRQRSTCSFTGSLSLPTIEDIPFTKGKIYVDGAGGSFGGTEKSGTLLRAALRARTGLVPYWTADGNLYFTGLGYEAPQVSVALRFLYDATAVAEEAAFAAETARLIRLEWEGSQIAGTSTNRTLRMDLAGKWTRFDVVGEQEGNDVVQGHFRARYNSTASHFAQLVVINDLASLP